MKISKSSFFVKALYLYIPILAFLFVLGIQNKIPVSTLVIDVFTVADIPAYTGFVSNIGILIWCFSCSVAFFSYSLMQSFPAIRLQRNLLLCSGLISLLLLLDDFFLLHERFFQTYFGIPEELTLAAYAIIFAVYIVSFRKIMLRSGSFFLLMTVLFLGLSTGFDFLENIFFANPDLTPDVMRLLEEGSKLLGVFSWGAYVSCYCYETLKKCYEPSRESRLTSSAGKI